MKEEIKCKVSKIYKIDVAENFFCCNIHLKYTLRIQGKCLPFWQTSADIKVMQDLKKVSDLIYTVNVRLSMWNLERIIVPLK